MVRMTKSHTITLQNLLLNPRALLGVSDTDILKKDGGRMMRPAKNVSMSFSGVSFSTCLASEIAGNREGTGYYLKTKSSCCLHCLRCYTKYLLKALLYDQMRGGKECNVMKHERYKRGNDHVAIRLSGVPYHLLLSACNCTYS
jgi:hypothetical protein